MKKQVEKEDLILEINDHGYESYMKIVNRIAVRGIIHWNQDFLLITNDKNKDYKFPGGGMEAGETQIQTLVREVFEETGKNIVEESIRYYGRVEEHKRGLVDDYFHMTSFYYICEVEQKNIDLKLDKYEKKSGYYPEIIKLEKAIKKNHIIKEVDKVPWVERDTKVMEYLKDNFRKITI